MQEFYSNANIEVWLDNKVKKLAPLKLEIGQWFKNFNHESFLWIGVILLVFKVFGNI